MEPQGRGPRRKIMKKNPANESNKTSDSREATRSIVLIKYVHTFILNKTIIYVFTFPLF